MPDTLTEIANPQQIEGEPKRRWFSSLDLDLIVWLNENAEPMRFQFCYDKSRAERALSWSPELGFTHHAVDSGEMADDIRHKASPILTVHDTETHNAAKELLHGTLKQLPEDVAQFVRAKLT